jgi:hypothetical protein
MPVTAEYGKKTEDTEPGRLCFPAPVMVIVTPTLPCNPQPLQQGGCTLDPVGLLMRPCETEAVPVRNCNAEAGEPSERTASFQ